MATTSRSYARITTRDLRRLLDLAKADQADFFARYPRWKRLCAHRRLGIALCQGAADHFVGRPAGKGVSDFDVWVFYRATHQAPYPYRRIGRRDFGDRRFGGAPGRPNFVGRCVDVLGRSIDAAPGTDPVAAIRSYLRAGRTVSARELAKKAVVMLEPSFGSIVWP